MRVSQINRNVTLNRKFYSMEWDIFNVESNPLIVKNHMLFNFSDSFGNLYQYESSIPLLIALKEHPSQLIVSLECFAT